MKYDLNIYFCKWDNLYSKAIRLATGAEFSHVGIGFREYSGNNIIYEALNQGFFPFPYGNLDNNPYVEIVTLKQVSAKEKEEIEKHLAKYIGRGYDWFDILIIGLSLIVPLKKLMQYDTPRKLICSEAVALVYKDIFGIDLSEIFGKSESFITPQELYDYFKSF